MFLFWAVPPPRGLLRGTGGRAAHLFMFWFDQCPFPFLPSSLRSRECAITVWTIHDAVDALRRYRFGSNCGRLHADFVHIVKGGEYGPTQS